MSFICEVKKASPSKGLIDPVFDYKRISKNYEVAGADCVSCLTEPKWFLGSDVIFGEVRRTIQLPMIRKDFTADDYQIYQAKCMGADAVILDNGYGTGETFDWSILEDAGVMMQEKKFFLAGGQKSRRK